MRGNNNVGSTYLALSEQDTLTPTIVTGFAPRRWNWANSSVQNGAAAIEIAEPGYHTLELWQREDGLRLDRILLTTDSEYNPTGNGPSESERIGDYDW